MSTRPTRLRILCAGALMVGVVAAMGSAARPSKRGQDPPAAQKEDKKGGGKKGEKADRTDTKGAAVVKVNVEVKGEGAPLADALVLVRETGGFERNSSTNSAGMAHFSQVPRGKVTVQVTAPGYKPHTTEEDLAGAEVNVLVALTKQ